MNPFAGKSPTERKKMIAAIVLGVVALFALYMAFGRGLFRGSTTVTVTASPTPRAAAPVVRNDSETKLPARDQQDFIDVTTPIVYSVTTIDAPPPGRNIFAFYEPPPPCPGCTPTPTPVAPKTPPPTPPPPMTLTYVTPQTVFAGSGTFRLEANGDKLDPSSRIYFNQSELPTRFLSPQKLVADVPSTMVAGDGSATVIAQTPDGKLYSNQLIIAIQPPPKPQFQYTGAKLSARGNNDTAYFTEQGKQIPTAARLNDVVAGRFRLVSISASETVFEDVNLGFRHRLQLYRPPAGSTTGGGTGPVRSGIPADGTYRPYNPNMPNPNMQPQDIPGIPSNVPRYQPPANVQRPPEKKAEDEDDDGDGN